MVLLKKKNGTFPTDAFTLVELIVVITILAVLATVGFLALQGYTKDAKDSATKTNVRTVAQAVELESAGGGQSVRRFASFSGAYAMSGKVLGAVLSGGTVGTAGTNYTPGPVDFAALKLDSGKFMADGSSYLMSAVDVSEKLVTGKTRTRTLFQIAALAGTSAYVEGTFSSALAASSSIGSETTVTGIIADPNAGTGGTVALSSNLDAPVADGGSSGGGSSGTPAPTWSGTGTAWNPWILSDGAKTGCKSTREAMATNPTGGAWSSVMTPIVTYPSYSANAVAGQDGFYSVDPDGAGALAASPVFCDMTTDGGGWTRVFKASSTNLNSTSIPYDGDGLSIIAASSESMIAFEDGTNEGTRIYRDSSIYNTNIYETSFPTPASWKTMNPLANPGQIDVLNAKFPRSGTTFSGVSLVYGYNYNRTGCISVVPPAFWGGPPFTGQYGGICITWTSAPFFFGFASGASDQCNSSADHSKNCDSRFVVYAR